jgi:hypothetical protein
VIDRRLAVAGAQPFEVFERALAQAWDETHPTLVEGTDEAAVCGPDGCALPA